MRKFVVGIDASSSAEVALRWAAQLAIAADAEIVAVHAFHRPYSEVTPDDHERLVAESSALLDGPWTEAARQVGATVRAVVHEGDPRVVVLETADRENADLVVLGRSGLGGEPGLLHLGSLAEFCAHHSDYPLAVIPRNAVVPTEHLVVGTDGSPESLSSIMWAADLAENIRTSVVAVDTPQHPLTHACIHNLVTAWTEPLKEAGVVIEPVAHSNETIVDGLLDAAAGLDADAIVVGARGTGGFTGLRVGGTAIKALHHAALPIILVPPTGRSGT
jgi:nucleotide-binding universal stress UspA family protein